MMETLDTVVMSNSQQLLRPSLTVTGPTQKALTVVTDDMGESSEVNQPNLVCCQHLGHCSIPAESTCIPHTEV